MTTYEIDAPLAGVPQDAPAGLVLRHPDGWRLIHTHNIGWISTQGNYMGETDHLDPALVVEHVPDTLPDTLTRYVQRFRTTALGASHANGINISQVQRALEAIGCNDIEAPMSPQMLVHFSDQDILRALPEGTVLRHGVSHLWEGQCWYVLRGNDLHHLLGPLRNLGHDLLTVHSIPDMSEPASWVTEPYDPAMQDEIDAFKDRAWELGGKAKQSHSWCGQYEVAMQRMGLTQAWAERPKPMSEQALADLPENAIIIGIDPANPGSFTLWRRTLNEERGLTYLWGTVTADYPAEGQPLAEVGISRNGHINARLSAIEQIEALPVGTVVNNPGHNTCTRLADGWATRPTQPTTQLLTNQQMIQYVPNTVLSIGNGVYRMGQEFTAEQVDHEPEGTHWLEANDDYSSWRLAVREDDDGGLRGIAEHNFTEGLPMRLVGEPGERILLTDYRILERLPVGSVIIYTASSRRDSYTKRARGWVSDAGGGVSEASAFRVAIRTGETFIESLPDNSDLDPRIGQPVTQAMTTELPIGTQVYGTRSQRIFRVTETGLNREGALPRYNKDWSEYSSAIESGRLIVESIPAQNEEAAEVVTNDPRWSPGMELTEWFNRHAEIDEMPVGSQLYGLGSHFTYTRVEAGWMATSPNGEPINSGHVYSSCVGFTGHNCSVVRVGAEVVEPF